MLKLGLEKDEASFAAGFATVEGLKLGLEKLAELAHEAVRFLGDQIEKTVQAGVEADRFAQKMGLTTKEVQELAYAGGTVGISLDEMQAAMRALALKGVTNLKGEMLSLADQFSKTKDGGYKLGIATEYLGRAGGRLIPILNKGRGEIEKLMSRAEELGVVMDADAIRATKEYDEATVDLSAALRGFWQRVVIPMLPTLREWAKTLTQLVVVSGKWIASIQAWRVHLEAAAVAVLGLGVLLLGLNGVLASTVTLIWSAVLPFIAWAVAIAAVYIAIDDLFVFFNNGDSLIGRALHHWLGPFKTWQEALGKVWKKVKDGFSAMLEDMKNDPEFAPFIALAEFLGNTLNSGNNAFSKNSKALAGRKNANETKGGLYGLGGLWSGIQSGYNAAAQWGGNALSGLNPAGHAFMPGGAGGPAAASSYGPPYYQGAAPIVINQTINTSADPAEVGKAASDGAGHGTKQALHDRRKAQHAGRT